MKKKNIKEPKFISYLAAALIPALIVALVINLTGYYITDQMTKEILSSGSNSPSNELLTSVIDLYFSDRTEDTEPDYLKGLSKVYAQYSMAPCDYHEILDGSDLIISTRISGFVLMDSTFYRLTDDPEFQRRYLETVGDYQIGNMDYWRTTVAGTVIISFDDNGDPASSLLNLGYRFMGLSCPDDIHVPNVVEDVYVDRDNLVFYPGKVEFSNIKGNTLVVDFTPADTEGLEHIVQGSFYDDTSYLCMMFAPHSDNGIANDNSYEFGTKAGNTVTIRTVSYNIPDLISLFPVQVSVVWIFVTAICLLIAFFVARYRYGRIKAMYDMIEYRRTTANAMAHDLKTPLAILSAYADNMAEEQDPGKLREYSFKMRENVESANRMLEDILDFSRSESGKITSNKEQVSLSDVISSSLDLHSDLFKQHGIKIKRIGNDLTLQTDRKLLSQAVDNLISNCARHATDNTTVDITIKDDRLCISNTTDLKTDSVEELLKPFVKGESSRGDSGTGLGLSIAKNDLELLGYKLLIDLTDQTFSATVRF